VDQPDVSEALVLDLVKCFRESGASVAMPVFRGRRGHPAIFGRGLLGELLNTPLDEGPKRVVMSREPVLLECSEPGTVTDTDTPADYLALTGISLQEALISLSSPRLRGEA